MTIKIRDIMVRIWLQLYEETRNSAVFQVVKFINLSSSSYHRIDRMVSMPIETRLAEEINR